MLRGRLAEALGHDKDALDEYKSAVELPRPGRGGRSAGCCEIALRQKRGEISQADALRELETLSVIWRGDAIEVKTLQMLARIYAEAGRYGERLQAAQDRDPAEPNSEMSRRARTRRPRCSRSCFSARRATICRRSTRSACSTNSAS